MATYKRSSASPLTVKAGARAHSNVTLRIKDSGGQEHNPRETPQRRTAHSREGTTKTRGHRQEERQDPGAGRSLKGPSPSSTQGLATMDTRKHTCRARQCGARSGIPDRAQPPQRSKPRGSTSVITLSRVKGTIQPKGRSGTPSKHEPTLSRRRHGRVYGTRQHPLRL